MRKLATAAAVSLALASGGVQALGLGEIEMRSALNQPMDAEIPLNSVRPGEVDGMIVQLASPDAFARAGIERSPLLTDLSFAVEHDEGGAPYIQVKSRRPILEPFLNFLVEIDWPDGRMVREYTVLLDPPVFMTPNATARDESADTPAATREGDDSLLAPAPVERNRDSASDDRPAAGRDLADTPDILEDDERRLAAGSSQPDDEAAANTGADRRTAGDTIALTDPDARDPAASARLDAAEITRRQQAARAERTADAASASESSPGGTRREIPETVEVAPGDTLFEIADRTRLPTTSTQQMMLALLAANEAAFIERNINLVRAGSILRIPSRDEQIALTQIDAVAEILRQGQLWRDYRDNLRALAASRPVDEAIDAGSREIPDGDAAGGDAPGNADPAAATDGTDAGGDTETAPATVNDELQIVADAGEAGADASATTDPASDGEAERIARIGRELQMAREELASTRLETDDLDDARSELVSTNENLDALVTLQQSEVAVLEAQLADARAAREAADAAGADDSDDLAAIDEALDAQREPSADGTDANVDRLASSSDENADDLSAATADDERVELGAATASEAASGDGTTNGDASGGAAESANGADNDSNANPAPLQPRAGTWYGDLIADNGGLMMAGAGALGLLGLGAVLWRRRRDRDFDEEGTVDYIDENEAGELQAELGRDSFGDESDAPVETASASAGPQGDEAPAEQDKILSEADVYIAYGLHGQAEELLAQAIAAEPQNPAYAAKLLETHHAQNQAGEFADGAADFRLRYGAAGATFWPGIAALGAELDPDNSLYREAPPTAMATTADESGFETDDESDLDAPSRSEAQTDSFDKPAAAESVEPTDDAAVAGTPDTAAADETSDRFVSAERSDSTASQAADDTDALDPAFAFSEADFEATGDFTPAASDAGAGEDTDTGLDLDATAEFDTMTDEPTAGRDAVSVTDGSDDKLDDAAGGDGSIDFDGFDLDTTASDASSGVSNDAPEHDATADRSADVPTDAPTADAPTHETAAAFDDDLTLDIDRLDGTLDDESSEILSEDFANIESLDFADLEAGNDSSVDADSSSGGQGDDVDVMIHLARAYIDMGDRDSASDALDKVKQSGNPEQVNEAETLLRKIS